MPKNKIRTYSLEVIADDISFFRESFITAPDHEPALAVGRVCCKIIRSWENAKLEEYRKITIMFVPTRNTPKS